MKQIKCDKKKLLYKKIKTTQIKFEVNPKVWTTKRRRFTFYMAKLTREQKIEIYKKRKAGESIMALSKQYDINYGNVKYLVKLIDRYGEDILRKDKNNYYSPELKIEIINKVLLEKRFVESATVIYGLSSAGMLMNWIRSYKENGYNIVEKKRGRGSTMKRSSKPIDPNDKDAIIKQKDKNIEYLKAEIEYLKKLRAVVQARKDRQSKIK